MLEALVPSTSCLKDIESELDLYQMQIIAFCFTGTSIYIKKDLTIKKLRSV
jgi:hypothetical protein